MSDETTNLSQPSDRSLLILLQDDNLDQLTDILVRSLYDAFRVLEDELEQDTLH